MRICRQVTTPAWHRANQAATPSQEKRKTLPESKANYRRAFSTASPNCDIDMSSNIGLKTTFKAFHARYPGGYHIQFALAASSL